MTAEKMPVSVAYKVIERAGGTCEAYLTRRAKCKRVPQHLHHRKMRSQGGENTPSNLLAVCHECHRWVHDKPAKAYELGLLVKSSKTPCDVPVLRRGNWALLEDTHRITPIMNMNNMNALNYERSEE